LIRSRRPEGFENLPSSGSSYSIERLSRDLQSGKLGVEEVVQEEIANIQNYSDLNAFVLTFDIDSKIVSDAIEKGKSYFKPKTKRRSGLAGIPFTIKDNVFVSGYRATNGCVAFKDFVPTVNGDVFDLFYSKGAIPLGKTNLHELALGPTCSASFFGPVRNPVDSLRVTGGSSGGSAVSVVRAKYALASIWSDTGGSVRIPAALCGICGFKPTLNTISAFGVFPLSATLDTVGVLARTMEDLVMSLESIMPEKFQFGSSKSKGKPRIGIPGERYFDGADKSIVKAFWDAIEKIRSEFEIVEGISIPDESKISRARRSIMLSEGSFFYSEVLRNEEYRKRMDPDVLAPLDAGLKMGRMELMGAQGFRLSFTSRMFAVFNDVDYVAMPTCLIEPPKLEDMLDRSKYAHARPLLIRNPEVWNLCGFPALSIPCHRLDGHALPAGLQIAGKYGDDVAVLEAGRQIWRLVHSNFS
jgi:aspartyl-tRNA(Asn)/glutamyl-tRNA(Gln) amidotransferase subunit A